MPLDTITATSDTFLPYVGDTFITDSAPEKILLTLDNVKIFKNSDVRDSKLVIDGIKYLPRQAFALTFVGPVKPILVSGMLSLSHKQIGTLALFISPFRKDQDCILYEVVFN
ncbi:hypothetical protein F0A16_15105 [Salinicola corii]|uniref:DUF6916 domain-containing protein n=1 Tax=Salinicola corii TaxID=2606937 RepID=A0A640WCJ1_9GAMM|nr:hypothetical protein [Salinicola corii]KAA0016826.1 hypothetical protein F0A16_15105 [Salinicola corii]